MFFENSRGTFIQSGSNNGMAGNGKVVMVDNQFMIEVLGILKEISTLLNKVCNKLEEKRNDLIFFDNLSAFEKFQTFQKFLSRRIIY